MKLLRSYQVLPKMKKPRDGQKHPRCGVKGCNSLLYKIKFDQGYSGPKKYELGRKPLQRTKRGRPRLPENKRIQTIGWWCKKCGIFYYEDGTVLPEQITVILRIG